MEVLPELPVTPTTVRPGQPAARTCAGQPAERGEHRGARAVAVGRGQVRCRRASRPTGGTITAGRVDRSRPASTPAAPGGDRGRGEVVPVDPLARQRQEQPARADRARVELDAPVTRSSPVGPVQAPTGRRRRPRPAVSGITARPRAARRRRMAAASSAASSNGCCTPRDLLAGLVALAGDHDGVARPGPAHRGARSPPAGRRSRAPRRVPRLGLRAGQHRGADRGRVLAARVVVGDDQQLGPRRRRGAHQRALAAVPVAAAAQHDDAAGRGTCGAQRVQQRGDRGRLVRVVDDGEERLPGVDPLHPARAPSTAANAGAASRGRHADRVQAGQREQRVGTLNAPGSRSRTGTARAVRARAR